MIAWQKARWADRRHDEPPFWVKATPPVRLSLPALNGAHDRWESESYEGDFYETNVVNPVRTSRLPFLYAPRVLVELMPEFADSAKPDERYLNG